MSARASSAVGAMVPSWTTSKQRVCRREQRAPSSGGVALAKTSVMSTFKASVVVLALLSGCATPRPGWRQDQSQKRLKDTPAEKMAALPVPDPAADPENQDR